VIDWPVKLNKNKYSKWYFNLMHKARNRKSFNGYSETHHVIPRSLGGSNDKSNLVVLTAKEHYIAHALLWKMDFSKSDHIKMNHAFNAMCITKNSKKHGNIDVKINSRLFEKLKIERHVYFTTDPIVQERLKRVGKEVGQRPKGENFKKLTSLRFTGRTDTQGEKNGMYRRKHSEESIKKMKIVLKTRVYSKEVIERRNTAIRASARVCEHCGKSCVLANYNRWHGIKCKMKVHNEQN
jgi:ribosomal protein S27AE